jgi:hypothetical protein
LELNVQHKDTDDVEWAKIIVGASGFLSSAIRTLAYHGEGKRLHAAGLATVAAGSAFAFFDGLKKLTSKLRKPSAPSRVTPNGVFGQWIADGIDGTISIVGNESDLHIFVPNSIGRFNILSGGARFDRSSSFFVATGPNSRGEAMLSCGRLERGQDAFDVMATTVVGWRGDEPMFADAAFLEFQRA